MSNSNKTIKVLFVSPKIRDNELTPPHFPLGIAYVAAYLRSKGILVDAIDFNVDDKENKIDKIINNYDYVGISAFATAQINHGYYIAQRIKNVSKNIKIVYGGYHTNIMFEEAFRLGFADYVIRGHGEIPFYKLITGKNKKKIPGLCYFEGGILHKNPINSTIDLNSLPFPAVDLFDLKKYQDDVHVLPHAKHTAIDVKSSMGCPNYCTYCSAPMVYRGKIFHKRPEIMLEEIKYYINNFGIRHFHFEDENWLINKQRIKKFCKLIIDNNIDIKYAFMSSINVMFNSLDIVDLLKKSGCVCIDLGLETADYSVQKNIHKSNNLKQLIRIDKILKNNNIYPFILIMTFNDGETLSSVANTTKFMLNLEKTNIKVIEYLRTNSSPYGFGQFATPHVGTKFFETASKRGLFLADKNYNLHVWTKPSYIPYTFLRDIPQVVKKFDNKKQLKVFLKKFERDILRYFSKDYLNIFWKVYSSIDGELTIDEIYKSKLKNMKLVEICLTFGMLSKFFIICSKK